MSMTRAMECELQYSYNINHGSGLAISMRCKTLFSDQKQLILHHSFCIWSGKGCIYYCLCELGFELGISFLFVFLFINTSGEVGTS